MSETPDAWWLRPRDGSAGQPGPLTITRRLDDLVVTVVPDPPPTPVADAAQAPVAEVAAPAVRRRPRTVWVLAGATTAALVAAAAFAATLGSPAPAAAPVRVVPIDPAMIHTTATSTQDDAGPITYGAANTLDGDPATAWNSDGAADRRGPGLRLTYTFAAPVDLRSIVLLNGYQKVRPRPGRTPVDLYPLNARVHRLRVVTDTGAWTWDLTDGRAPQTFTRATGRTSSVRLEIVSVYPGRTYPDVAVSEASFTAAAP